MHNSTYKGCAEALKVRVLHKNDILPDKTHTIKDS